MRRGEVVSAAIVRIELDDAEVVMRVLDDARRNGGLVSTEEFRAVDRYEMRVNEARERERLSTALSDETNKGSA